MIGKKETLDKLETYKYFGQNKLAGLSYLIFLLGRSSIYTRKALTIAYNIEPYSAESIYHIHHKCHK